MRMKLAGALALAVGLMMSPEAARAQSQALGCIVGPTDLNRCTVSGGPAVALAAIAVPVLVTGAAVSVAHELTRRTEERATDENVGTATPSNGKHAPLNLALVPEPPDPYRAPAKAKGDGKEKQRKPNAAFEFNENATNVATVVAGAMVAGAIIATVAHAAHK